MLLAVTVYAYGELQAQAAAEDDSYTLDGIREVGRPVEPPLASTGRIQRQLDASFPRTGFELRNGSSWTTPAEEQQFLNALDTASDRIRITTLARTVQNRPIQLVLAGPPLTNSAIKTRGAILLHAARQ